jgi:hypothetical protein
MPYLITIKTHHVWVDVPDEAEAWEIHSRRPVASLDEARAYIREATEEPPLTADQEQAVFDAWWSLDESGGTIGPLPDGTIIEVVRED